MSNILKNKILKTEQIEWKKLIPFQPDNLKKTEPYKLQKLANSLCENGLTMNFYVWEKDGKTYIIDGHTRYEILQLLETGAIRPRNKDGKEYDVIIPDKFPCSFLHLKTKQEAKKAVLIFNSHYKSIAQDVLQDFVADLDFDEIKSQIEIPELNFDSFEPKELENDTIDDTAKIQTNIKLGDLIEICRHKLLCGDSTKEEDVSRLMNGEKASCIFTDPPYGVSIGAKNRLLNKMIGSNANTTDIQDDSLSPEELKQRLLPAFKNIKNLVMADDCTLFVTAPQGGELGMMMMMMMQESDLQTRHVLIWKKNHATFSMGRLDYDYQHEPILLTLGKKHKRPMNGKHKTSVWEIDRPQSSKEHPTMKPVELYENAYMNNSDSNDIVFDAYSGSGTMFVAAQTTNRTARGIEISPEYCQVIINRMRKNFPELEIKVNGQEYRD